MLAVSHHRPSVARALHLGVMDDTGTIDPAALNASASTTTITPRLLSQPQSRGTKRSRSPDGYGNAQGREDNGGDLHTNKRSRPLKSGESPSSNQQMPLAPPVQPVQTPHIRTQSLPQASPSQSSPQQSTPGSVRAPVVKALPTVRDHTTDQLGPEGDEYLPRETDPDGELKVSKDGNPQGGRKYKCRTFKVPNRGEKMFMLATECARVLGYRDSYLLFNKNRSLYKIIANQQEKDNLIHQEILPYSYRSRQIAIVTARSMFRQFGSRLIESGRRVRDDYWEAKARKQGFTEEDAAGEKRPGAAKAREAAAAVAHETALSLPQGEIIYTHSNGPGFEAPPGMHPSSLAPLPMIHMPDDLRSKDYNIMRPRQEPSGPAWQDRSNPSNQQEILTQASQAAEFNKLLGQQRAHREKYLDDFWKRPHEQPSTEAPSDGNVGNAVAPQHLQSPQAGMAQARQDQNHLPHTSGQMMGQTYPGYANPQNPMQSPVQAGMHRSLPPSQMHQSSPSMNMGAAGHRQTPSYGNYQQPQPNMWPPPQPQPSPLPQNQMYNQHHQSPMAPPQMPQQGSMGYGQMPGYGGMNRGMYQPSQSPQQFNVPGGANQQPGMGGWNPPGSAGQMPQDWQRYQ